MEIALKALLIFLQSIPVGSYYQIIGFGSKFIKYDQIPKEYKKENIEASINIIKKLTASLGGTNIYQPLKDIYNSKDYDNINLPKNIFLLTDGAVGGKKLVLDLIESNNSKFAVFSIGIGNNFDEDLIKNAGIVGKGNYNFCKNLDKLNSIIASEIYKCCNPFISDLEIKCSLDNKNKFKNNIRNIIRANEIINLNYIIEDDNLEKDIKLKMKYKDDKKEQEKDYEIIPELLEKGEDLSQLIIYRYIANNNNLSYEEKIKLALKYQIFIEGTSLFAEIELDEKISSEMKQLILGEKDQNLIINKNYLRYHQNYTFGGDIFGDDISDLKCCKEKSKDTSNDEKGNNINNNKTDELMDIINTQDFIEGFWEENALTKKIIEKYKKEFQLIKGLKSKKIYDKTAITILIIYFINKEHPQSLNDLLMIIKKAEKYIQKVTKDSYENIIKEANIN